MELHSNWNVHHEQEKVTPSRRFMTSFHTVEFFTPQCSAHFRAFHISLKKERKVEWENIYIGLLSSLFISSCSRVYILPPPPHHPSQVVCHLSSFLLPNMKNIVNDASCTRVYMKSKLSAYHFSCTRLRERYICAIVEGREKEWRIKYRFYR